MQNFDHLMQLLPMFNKIPEHKDCSNDLTKVRECFFSNHSKFYRQTIVHTEFVFPILNTLLSKNCYNYRGLLKEKVIYSSTVEDLKGRGVSFELTRLDIDDHTKEADQKFNYFSNKIWQKLRSEEIKKRLVIFVSNYFEVLKLKAYFKFANSPVEVISEYTEKKKVQSLTAKFNQGKIPYLLISERAHFYRV